MRGAEPPANVEDHGASVFLQLRAGERSYRNRPRAQLHSKKRARAAPKAPASAPSWAGTIESPSRLASKEPSSIFALATGTRRSKAAVPKTSSDHEALGVERVQ